MALFVACALLLSLERVAYIWIWRHPATFRAWCAHPALTLVGGPVEVVRALFVVFKIVQAAAFVLWCYVKGGGVLAPSALGTWPSIVGLALIGGGQTLTLSAFARLGRLGVFYGSRFGHTLPWSRAFPYSLLSHPQYVGAVASIWGLFLILRFPFPDWYVLPALETVYYTAGARLER